MTHSEIQELLDAFHDRQLGEADRQEVESHLPTCASCREAVDRLANISRSVFRPVPIPPTEFFVTRVMARLEQSPVSPRVGIFQDLWQWAALTLTALAAFFIISAPAERPSPVTRACSTSSVLLAGSGARFVSEQHSAEPMDSLLDLPEEI